jgi:hypothetical protein
MFLRPAGDASQFFFGELLILLLSVDCGGHHALEGALVDAPAGHIEENRMP